MFQWNSTAEDVRNCDINGVGYGGITYKVGEGRADMKELEWKIKRLQKITQVSQYGEEIKGVYGEIKA